MKTFQVQNSNEEPADTRNNISRWKLFLLGSIRPTRFCTQAPEDPRQNTVEHMQGFSEARKNEFQQFVDTELDTYLANMKKNGTYADHPTISATSEVLECSIKIVHANGPDTVIGHYPGKPLVIGYIQEILHYVSLEAIDRYTADNFVKVLLRSGRIEKEFLAKILEIDDNEELVHLRFFKPTASNPGVYVWHDTSWESKDSIVCKINPPTLVLGRGVKFRFDNI